MDRRFTQPLVGLLCVILIVTLLPIPAAAETGGGDCLTTPVYGRVHTWSDMGGDIAVKSTVTMQIGTDYDEETDYDDSYQIESGDTHHYEALAEMANVLSTKTWGNNTWIVDGEPISGTCESPDINSILESQAPQWVKDQIAEIGCTFSTESSNYSYNGSIYKDETHQTLYLSQSGAADLNLTATPVFGESMDTASIPAGAVITSIQISAVGREGDNGGCVTELI